MKTGGLTESSGRLDERQVKNRKTDSTNPQSRQSDRQADKTKGEWGIHQTATQMTLIVTDNDIVCIYTHVSGHFTCSS